MTRHIFFFLALLGITPFAGANSSPLSPFQSLHPGDSPSQQAAVQALLAQTDDPAQLLQAANLFQAHCVDPLINTLEYWGPDAETQAQLRPSAPLLLSLINRADNLASQRADAAARDMQSASDSTHLARWQQLTEEVKAALDAKVAAEYAQLLAAEPEEKNSIAPQALAALKSSDFSPAKFHLQTAKILLAANQPQSARSEFAAVLPASSADLAMQYQARYFLSVCDLEENDFPAARQDQASLIAWQQQDLMANNPAPQSTTAADDILQYRICSAAADAANSTAARDQSNQQAITALRGLIQTEPALKPAALERFGRRFAAVTDLDHADPLILEALVQRASASDADSQTQASGEQAAEIIVRRSSEFDQATVDYASALSAAILERTGQTAVAANAYLTLAHRLADRKPSTAGAALDRAIALFQNLPPNARIQSAYAQAMQMAIAPPFNQTNLFYADAQLLMQQGDYPSAIHALSKIPPDDPHHAEAQLACMVCIRHVINANSSPSRQQSAEQIDLLTAQILKEITGPSETAARAILVDAEQHQTNHQPAAALSRLDELPSRSRGLPDEPELLNRAAELRIAALIELQHPVEAANILATNSHSLNVPIANLVQQLNKELDSTQDPHQRIAIANARLQVATWLLAHLPNRGTDAINRYRLFYADSLRRAGELETNSETQKSDLQKALDQFQQIVSSESLEPPDPAPLLGEASAEFDLKNYATTRDILLPLINAGRLGDGQGLGADSYWQAMYELLASNAGLAAQGQASSAEQSETASYLKRLYIQWGNQIGGKHWHSAFESLRRQIAPDFVPSSSLTP